MSYMYQWFGVMTGWAFMSGCMLGMASLATRQMRPARRPDSKAEQLIEAADSSRLDRQAAAREAQYAARRIGSNHFGHRSIVQGRGNEGTSYSRI